VTGLRRPAALAGLLATPLLAAAVLAPAPALAQPEASVTVLSEEPGLLRLELVVGALPDGNELDLSSVSVRAGDTPLEVREVAEAETRATETAPAQRRLGVLVIDVSDSMAGQPLADAVAAARRYVDELPEDVDLAVVTAGAVARTVLEPTGDRAEARRVLGELVTEGSTALYDGLMAAADLAADARRYAERRVLVLSDGADSSSATGLPDLERRLAEVDVPVDTVAFRTEVAVTDLLAALSRDTGGHAYEAADAEDLAGAFTRAARMFTVRVVVVVAVPAELSGAAADLEVSVHTGRQTVSATVPVTFPRVVTGEPVPVAAGGPPVWAEIGLAALVFLGLLAVGLVAVSPLLERDQRRRRLAQLEAFTVAPPAPPPSPSDSDPTSQVARAALALSERVVRARGLEARIALELDRAGMRLRPHEWLLLRALICLIAVLLLTLFVGPLAAVPLGVVLGWAGTWLYQRWRADRRAEAFAALLPDALQLVIGSLRSGFSLSQAVDAMARELPDPVSTEFGRALGETRLGASLDDALERVAVRMRSTDLAWAVVAVRVQQEVGGNLAEVLTTTVNTLRERNSLRRHVRALSAEGRISAWILVALPVVAGAFMLLFRREYMRPLVTEPVGIAMLAAGIVLVVVGTVWMSRMVRVEV
jgi:Flp pilus assembly protein TadB/Mg-chelatase subunit ChlD